MMAKIGVVGLGAWGTALALTAARAGSAVTGWARDPALVEEINRTGRNEGLLPGIPLDPPFRATAEMADLSECDAILLVTPAQPIRQVCAALRPHLKPGAPVILCSKGIEQATGALMSEAAEETLPGTPIGALSGPTFARDVALGLPSATTLALPDQTMGEALAAMIGTRSFRPYWTDDLIGVEVGGAVKNVIAIACGIVAGRGLGDNARAALITRGLAETARLGAALGGRRETLMGLSGLGDLALTCSGLQSRNYSAGLALGQGQTLAEILSQRRAVTEGVATAGAVVTLAGKRGVDMPIAAAVDGIVNHGRPIDAVMTELLSRPFRAEGH